MNAKDRFRAVCRGEKYDRLPIMEWAPWWDQTIRRWHEEGLPKDLDTIGIQQYFGLDASLQVHFGIFKPGCPQAKSHGAGIIKDEADYDRVLPFLYPEPETILTDEVIKNANKYINSTEGAMFWYTVLGFFWAPRDLFGIENHLYSFYDEPELYHRICRDLVQWQKKVIKFCTDNLDFTFMTFAEDMSYNNGPMLSEDMFEEFLAPYYKEVIPEIKKTGVVTFVDSDGDITKAVKWYESVGAEGMLPLERQAGVDVAKYIEMCPEMTFLGHYDKMIMHKGEDALRAEFERLLPSVKKGKVIIGVDHQTPPAVSMEDYKTYIKLFKEYAVKGAK